MNALFLGGNAAHNKQWIYQVRDELGSLFGTTVVHNYAHWESGEDFIDFGRELAAVAAEEQGLPPYMIFGKSVGSVLAARGIGESKLHPAAALFAGLPLKLIQREHIPVRQWLQSQQLPTTIVQNEHDPAGSFDEVREYIGDTPHIQVISLPGDTHDYTDFIQLAGLARQLLT